MLLMHIYIIHPHPLGLFKVIAINAPLIRVRRNAGCISDFALNTFSYVNSRCKYNLMLTCT
jgi:hypothetical protein